MQVTQAIVTALLIQTVNGDARSVVYQGLSLTNVIFSNYLLFESRAWTQVQCSLHCLNHAGCVTFTFTAAATSTSSGTCRGHSNRHQCWDSYTATANTQYYGTPELARQNKVANCRDMLTLQPGSGVRQLCETGTSLLVSTYCDQDTDGGGWTVIQRRQDGSVNFRSTWADYQAGFGIPAGEYWLGLENIHKMTSSQCYEIRFDLQLYDGTTGYAVYRNFSVGPSSDFYRLNVGTKTAGNLYNGFAYNNGMRFSTWNSDNDVHLDMNCAAVHDGGWWYRACSELFLNDRYRHNSTCENCNNVCQRWSGFGPYCSNALQKTAMKIRPLSL